ncbi:hypothetical protein BaRGS_00013334 [Batillaria attramentaria]|uniref:Uncharacterized protein n=1 Tax=Batillaria attramentaria TaxID=370345 RepID=A0ABD0L7U1_9CAEN
MQSGPSKRDHTGDIWQKQPPRLTDSGGIWCQTSQEGRGPPPPQTSQVAPVKGSQEPSVSAHCHRKHWIDETVAGSMG